MHVAKIIILGIVLFFFSCSEIGKAPIVETKKEVVSDGIDPEANLTKLGIELPPVSPPVANYVNVVRTGNLLFSCW